MNLVFYGPPGAGKGTIAKVITEQYNIPQISAGDLLREEKAKTTPLAKEIKSFIESGKLVPDEVVIKIIKARLSQKDCVKGFILDGFPRTMNQAKELDKVVKLDAVFLFNVTKEKIIERLSGRRNCPKCGKIYHIENIPPKIVGKCDICSSVLFQRDDDKPAAISERIDIFYKNSQELVNYYDSKKVLFEIDANLEVDGILEQVGPILERVSVKKK